jgi:hypothetical protein
MVNSFSAGVSFPVFFWPFGGGLASAEIFRRARGHKAALSRRDAPELHMITCRASIWTQGRREDRVPAGWRNSFLRATLFSAFGSTDRAAANPTLSDLPDGQSTADASKVDVFK